MHRNIAMLVLLTVVLLLLLFTTVSEYASTKRTIRRTPLVQYSYGVSLVLPLPVASFYCNYCLPRLPAGTRKEPRFRLPAAHFPQPRKSQ